ncbi:MAG: hypothetical protein GY711_13445 [bacterium]|nr:hypothetical protein [bacterium]
MIRPLVACSALALTAATSAAQVRLSHSVNNTEITGYVLMCSASGVPWDTSTWRAYTPADHGQLHDFEVERVFFGISMHTAPTDMPAVVRVYADSSPGMLGPLADLTLLGEATMLVPNEPLVHAVDFAPPLFFDFGSGDDLVIEVELDVPEPNTDQIYFAAGANDEGETRPTYLSASNCGVAEPQPLASLGFPDSHVIIDPVVDRVDIGNTYCPAHVNSTGFFARLLAQGSDRVGDNALTLLALRVPKHQVGYFLMSDTRDFVPYFGGSLGILCLGQPLVRFSDDIVHTGTDGEIVFTPDLTQLPQMTVIQPGETWNFQLWFRDIGNTSNTSTATEVIFQ